MCARTGQKNFDFELHSSNPKLREMKMFGFSSFDTIVLKMQF